MLSSKYDKCKLCGLIPLYGPQVTADINGSSAAVPVNETGIAWGSDVKHKFGSQSAQFFNLQENAGSRGGNTITGKCHTPTAKLDLYLIQCSVARTLIGAKACVQRKPGSFDT